MSGKRGYWQRYASPRLNRRGFLGASAAAAASIALAACGDGSAAPSPTAEATPGVLGIPEDTTSAARQGGTLKSVAIADVPSYDPHSTASALVHLQVAAYTYPRMSSSRPPASPTARSATSTAISAESFELSPDRLQLTLRLRQGLKWDAKAPVNGRTIDAQDVAASWARFLKLNPLRTDIAYDAAPRARVAGRLAVAPGCTHGRLQTQAAGQPHPVALRLRPPLLRPAARGRRGLRPPCRACAATALTGSAITGRLVPLLDPATPTISSRTAPSSTRSSCRSSPTTPRGWRQFKAGTIWTHVAIARATYLAVTARDCRPAPPRGRHLRTTPSSLAFGYDFDSPWKDERLRQAVSMLLDRETLIDVHTNRDRFTAEGVDCRSPLPHRRRRRLGRLLDRPGHGAYLRPEREVLPLRPG